MIDLTDRVVLVTGAGGGIGSATARTLAGAGATVVIHDVTATALASLAGELGDRGHPLPVDLRDRHATQALWRDALAICGRIDVLVNNAGIYPPAPLDLALDDWTAVWDLSLGVNLLAPAILCREAIASFSGQAGGGIIVNLASRAAFRGEDPEFWHYAAAKAGIVAMTRTIARQYGRQGVTAFAVAPGYVDTPFNAPFAEKFGVDVAARDTGLGEVAQPQDVANVIAFLASGLARHATGTTIDINGASYVR
jgi:NAD(P)-dependent dehydrogenase (short-subunit alcohol dehydrogenase family)